MMEDFFPPPIELPNENTILDAAVEAYRRESKTNPALEETSRYLVICGSNDVGKTTVTSKFLEIPYTSGPTLMIDYAFRIKNVNEDAPGLDACHVWELSNGPMFTHLLKNVEIGSELSIVLMLDLSKPNLLWFTIQTVLKSVKEYVTSRFDAKELKKKSASFIPSEHSDKAHFKPYAAPLVIIGGKYDAFKVFEPEKKRIVCFCLRYIAHVCCAYLLFHSNLDNSLLRHTKSVLGKYGYGMKQSNIQVVKDYNKPLFIPPGEDSFEQIRSSSKLKLESLEDCRTLLGTYFTQEDPWTTFNKSNPKDDPNFREPRIDDLLKEKDKELEILLEEMKKKGY